MPSAAPEDDSASDQYQRPGPALYGEPAQGGGDPYEELDAEARRDEWAADLGGAPEVPRQSDPRPAGPQAFPEPPSAEPAPQGHTPQGPPPQDQGAQGEWGEVPDWPPKSSQDWMHQQSQTGWGLANGGGTWPAQGPGTPGDAAPAGPEQGAPAEGGLEFPELRSDPYEADVYGHSQYRGDSGGQDLYQSDPYQADRLQAEAQQAREQYQAEQSFEPFAAPAPQQPAPAFAEQPAAQFPPESQFQPAPPEPQQSYGDHPFGERQESAVATEAVEAVPAQRRPEESAPPEAPASTDPRVTRVAPPTHVGVRYAIYGIGGLITLGLIIGIVLMLGAAPPSEPSEKGGDDKATEEAPATEDSSLTSERYVQLAGAVGTAEWFSWRYGEAGGGSGTDELPATEGDALASAPLLGDADRSVQGQLGYLTDESNLSGVDHVTAVEATDELIGLAPRAGGRFSDDGTPELELQEGTTADCLAGLGGDLGKPVALARPEQSAEINAHSVIAFSSGIIATAGISGAQGGTCVQLPAGQVPTDVALTDGNELALVTTWNADTQTGALTMIALGDKSGSYQSSWSESYPGLPNPGHFATAAVVGSVELPFTAPTSVDAWSNSGGSLSLGRGKIDGDAHRDTVATAGYAIVGDLSASQVTVVDLASTLEGLAAQHYDGTQFQLDAVAGDAVDVEGGVADVAATEGASAVATRDGVVHELDASLQETSATPVGANPTCLVVGAQSGAFIATSRGEATISWVSGGAVTKELADSRLVDPLCASETPALDVKGYTGKAAVVLVSDFEGQQLHAYLDGQASAPGGATVGGDGFTYSGAYTVAGKPWGASVTVDLD